MFSYCRTRSMQEFSGNDARSRDYARACMMHNPRTYTGPTQVAYMHRAEESNKKRYRSTLVNVRYLLPHRWHSFISFVSFVSFNTIRNIVQNVYGRPPGSTLHHKTGHVGWKRDISRPKKNEQASLQIPLDSLASNPDSLNWASICCWKLSNNDFSLGVASPGQRELHEQTVTRKRIRFRDAFT